MLTSEPTRLPGITAKKTYGRRFCTLEEARKLLNERVGDRVQQCFKILKSDRTLYLEKRWEVLNP